MTKLTVEALLKEAAIFAKNQSKLEDKTLYGITDGKAVGTAIEHRFREHLLEKYDFTPGNSANGIDFPVLKVDIKVTSIKQPQSSCPFKSARQKIYGLGYSLLVFVYDKIDDPKNKTTKLNFLHTVYVEEEYTGDFQTTKGILKILENEANQDDITAFMQERNLPIDDIQATQLAEEILKNPPKQGYLTISNALQWRLQYGRVIQVADKVKGVIKILK